MATVGAGLTTPANDPRPSFSNVLSPDVSLEGQSCLYSLSSKTMLSTLTSPTRWPRSNSKDSCCFEAGFFTYGLGSSVGSDGEEEEGRGRQPQGSHVFSYMRLGAEVEAFLFGEGGRRASGAEAPHGHDRLRGGDRDREQQGLTGRRPVSPLRGLAPPGSSGG